MVIQRRGIASAPPKGMWLRFTGCGLAAAGIWSSGNFHAVIPGELYRSGQPSPERLTAYQREFAIRTVLNLRGNNTGKVWYDREVAAALRLGMAHIDFRMSSKREFTRQKAAGLLAILKAAPKPVLIHCSADSSGLVAALYVAQIAQRGEKAAEEQISIRYGHLGIPVLSAAFAMDSSWEDLEPWLGFGNS
jgi:protein tyrosine/serine phosphatase